ncbi:hypothetical protein [Streptomyces mirabilis]
MARDNKVVPLTGTGSFAASRSPGRPASATATALNKAVSCGVRRRYRTVNPSTCSANVTRGHPGASQNRRRIISSIHTCRPPTAPSARRH